MLDKYLKIFDLNDNFSLSELDERYKVLLKEFDSENIEDELKFIFLEEQEKIGVAYHFLLDRFNSDIPSNLLNDIPEEDYLEVPVGYSVSSVIETIKRNKIVFSIASIILCILLLSSVIFLFLDIKGTDDEFYSIPIIEAGIDYEIIKNHDPEWDYIRNYDGSYSVRKKSDPPEVWSEPSGKGLEAVKKVFESAEEQKPCECGGCEKYKNRRNE